jgi:cytochrome c556
MTSRARLAVLGAAFGLALAGISAGWAQDATTAIDQRQDLMKTQGKTTAAIKAFVEGRGELAAAQAAGAELLRTTASIPSVFPQQTSMAEYPGKTYAKPDIWAKWNQFTQAANTAHERAEALNTALQGGDKAAIATAFEAMGKQGCGGCHTPFRQPKT